MMIETVQAELAAQFRRVIRQQRLSAAYVFSGAVGTGKADMAQYVACALFCESPDTDGRPDGTCQECRRVLAHEHPDLVWLETDEKHLKVDDMRELESEFDRTGVEHKQRVFVIVDADKMTASAANAILKYYEEPAAGHVIILTTAAKNRLLPTILSRAQIVQFQTPPLHSRVEELVAAGIASGDATLLAELTADNAQALALSEDSDFAARVHAVEELLMQLATRNPLAFVSVKAKWLPLAKKLPEQQQMLQLSALYFSAALNAHYRDDYKASYAAELVGSLAAWSGPQLRLGLSAWLTAQRRLAANVTFESAVEAAILIIEKG